MPISASRRESHWLLVSRLCPLVSSVPIEMISAFMYVKKENHEDRKTQKRLKKKPPSCLSVFVVSYSKRVVSGGSRRRRRAFLCRRRADRRASASNGWRVPSRGPRRLRSRRHCNLDGTDGKCYAVRWN